MEQSMEAERAHFFAGVMVAAIEAEWKVTRKVIAAIPADRGDYRPDPKARTAAELAWHIASSEVWFLECLLEGQFKMEEPNCPPEIRTPEDIIAWYENAAPPLVERVKAIPGAKLAEPLSFFGMFSQPAAMYLNLTLAHSVHHRGQLSVYLRPMGSRVPSIYGGSADEPFESSLPASETAA